MHGHRRFFWVGYAWLTAVSSGMGVTGACAAEPFGILASSNDDWLSNSRPFGCIDHWIIPMGTDVSIQLASMMMTKVCKTNRDQANNMCATLMRISAITVG
jgi:hypothetical protein